MKTVSFWIVFSAMVFSLASPAFAGDANEQSSTPAKELNGAWQEFKNDWKQIGDGAKETGVAIGDSIKREVQEMPENMRRGYEETKKEVEAMTGSGSEDGAQKEK